VGENQRAGRESAQWIEGALTPAKHTIASKIPGGPKRLRLQDVAEKVLTMADQEGLGRDQCHRGHDRRSGKKITQNRVGQRNDWDTQEKIAGKPKRKLRSFLNKVKKKKKKGDGKKTKNITTPP